MKRYSPTIYAGFGTTFADMEPDPDGPYVLASKAQAEIDRLRGLVREAFREGVAGCCGLPDMTTDEMWAQSLANRKLSP